MTEHYNVSSENTTNSTQVTTYVLTLKRHMNRQSEIKTHLNSLGVKFEFFYGVDGTKDNHKYFDDYNERQNAKRRCYKLSRGEQACFIGHKLLWEKCIELNQPILVLEDDAILSSVAIKIMPELLESLKRWPYIKLAGMDNSKKNVLLQTIGDHQLLKWSKPALLAIGYLMSPLAAKKFIAGHKYIAVPVDNYMDAFYEHGVEQVIVYPFLCDQSINSAQSTITDRHQERFERNFIYHLNRLRSTLRVIVKRGWHNFLFARKLKKG